MGQQNENPTRIVRATFSQDGQTWPARVVRGPINLQYGEQVRSRAEVWAESVKAERPSWCARMRAFIFRSKGGA